ncbi:HCL588Cp [Eremothecium sinecaudum]|uniref:Peptidyl-prolyl cis-trans isomerase n=1 Tax=Eremothecium sinecaudum TaxID=45286 RepID=A0A109UXW7_9SACH|nr:HCL588Cp [Eremothecium sinecaudum]AMD19563.1 HCL588Cp [Eremothecium sinecaudum]
MSVLLETTVGDLVVDLDYRDYSVECYNFIKLCKCGFYNYQCFHNVIKHYSAELGDPQVGFGEREDIKVHNTSIEGIEKDGTVSAKLVKSSSTKNDDIGTKGKIGFIYSGPTNYLIGSKMIVALSELPKSYKHTVFFGEVISSSHSSLDAIGNSLLDDQFRPKIDVRVRKVHIIHDPFPDTENIPVLTPPLPLRDVRLPPSAINIASTATTEEDIRRKEVALEVFGDIKHRGIKPADNVLFICKLNPLTKAKDIAQIFSRFGSVVSVEIIKDKEQDHSLGYGFIQFESKQSCELAYSKMEGVLIDDRRIHVDFSQSTRRGGRRQTSK